MHSHKEEEIFHLDSIQYNVSKQDDPVRNLKQTTTKLPNQIRT